MEASSRLTAFQQMFVMLKVHVCVRFCQLSGVLLMLCDAREYQQMTSLMSRLIDQFANSTRWLHRQL